MPGRVLFWVSGTGQHSHQRSGNGSCGIRQVGEEEEAKGARQFYCHKLDNEYSACCSVGSLDWTCPDLWPRRFDMSCKSEARVGVAICRDKSQTLLCAVMKNCYLCAQFERNLVTRFAT
ncbi:hypothetical protein ACLKA7_009290 [Drosophila subpalustris]